MIYIANPSFQWWVRGVRRHIRMENKKGNMGTTRVCRFRIYPNTKRQAAMGYSISTHQRLTPGQRGSHAQGDGVRLQHEAAPKY